MQDNNRSEQKPVESPIFSVGQLEIAHDAMTAAFMLLKEEKTGSREHSLALTKLEEAMMWNNKDRTIRGFLKANETHAK